MSWYNPGDWFSEDDERREAEEKAAEKAKNDAYRNQIYTQNQGYASEGAPQIPMWEDEDGNFHAGKDQFHGEDDELVIRDPSRINLAWANPELYAELQHVRGNRDKFNDAMMGYTDPSRYAAMSDRMAANASTDIANRMAAMGLGGSSVSMYAQNSAVQNVDQQMIDRKLRDQMQISQMDALLSGQASSLVGNIQAGFGNFQSAMANYENGKEVASNAMWGDIAKGAGAIIGAGIGAFAGGPAGAVAGGTAGAAAGGAIAGASGDSVDARTASLDPGRAYAQPYSGINYNPMGMSPMVDSYDPSYDYNFYRGY